MGWRAFWSEIVIVVLGVVIALAANEAVQDWAWRNKVKDAEVRLRRVTANVSVTDIAASVLWQSTPDLVRELRHALLGAAAAIPVQPYLPAAVRELAPVLPRVVDAHNHERTLKAQMLPDGEAGRWMLDRVAEAEGLADIGPNSWLRTAAGKPYVPWGYATTGLFAPDPDSTLLAEVAGHTADTFNECGFDMIYLDALDGEDVLAGRENAWHYGSKFAVEIANRLNKPALFEMSTFHHHLWYIRARMGAWDHPNRSHKEFIDIHAAGNLSGGKTFLPMNLGWWAVKVWAGPQSEPTFSPAIVSGRRPIGNAVVAVAGVMIRSKTLKNSSARETNSVLRTRAASTAFAGLGNTQHGSRFPGIPRIRVGSLPLG